MLTMNANAIKEATILQPHITRPGGMLGGSEAAATSKLSKVGIRIDCGAGTPSINAQVCVSTNPVEVCVYVAPRSINYTTPSCSSAHHGHFERLVGYFWTLEAFHSFK